MKATVNQIAMPAKTARQRRHSGFTLVEMMIVISLSSIVLATIGIVFQGLRGAQRAIGDHQTAIDNIARLAQQFRADVHSATSAEIAAVDLEAAAWPPDAGEKSDAAQEILKLPQPEGKEVDYRLDRGSMTRVVRSGNQIAERESYALPENCRVQWQLDDSPNSDATTKRATALLSYPLGDQELEFSGERKLRIDAIVNLHEQEETSLVGRQK